MICVPVGSLPQVGSEMRVEEREGSGLAPPRCPTAVGAHKTPTERKSSLAVLFLFFFLFSEPLDRTAPNQLPFLVLAPWRRSVGRTNALFARVACNSSEVARSPIFFVGGEETGTCRPVNQVYQKYQKYPKIRSVSGTTDIYERYSNPRASRRGARHRDATALIVATPRSSS